jgi:hypothetical protein
VYLDRGIVSFYYPRPSLRALFAQYFGYGQGRARTLLRRRRLLSPRPLVPFAAVTSLSSFALVAAVVPGARALAALAWLFYGGALAAESARVSLRSRAPEAFPALVPIFATMHAAHGLGVWAGLLRNAGRGLAHLEPERLGARA